MDRKPSTSCARLRRSIERARSSAATLAILLALVPASSRAGDEKVAGAATAWGPVQLVVYKSKRTLALYREGNFEKEYPVVLGLVPVGTKRHEGDARTPEGLYHVTARQRHPRWQYFLALDYPNAADRAAWSSAVKKGKIPDEDGSPFAVGGSVGIHGNDRLVVQEAGIDWTKGCVALRPADIVELAAKVPVGTPVWIVQ
jgi:murein L,D-transpeptidase YafK